MNKYFLEVSNYWFCLRSYHPNSNITSHLYHLGTAFIKSQYDLKKFLQWTFTKILSMLNLHMYALHYEINFYSIFKGSLRFSIIILKNTAWKNPPDNFCCDLPMYLFFIFVLLIMYLCFYKKQSILTVLAPTPQNNLTNSNISSTNCWSGFVLEWFILKWILSNHNNLIVCTPLKANSH